ncbi:MAG: phycobilisome linker polypeptide [Phormidesmis sp.]
MSGMKTMPSAGISDYQNRTMTIGVTGMRQQPLLKTSDYQVQVPYSQMSQALQSIHRRGGKVAFVQLASNSPVSSKSGNAEPDSQEASSPQKAPASKAEADSKENPSSQRKRQ